MVGQVETYQILFLYYKIRGGNTGIRGYPTRKSRAPKLENHVNVYPKPDPIYFRVLQYPPWVFIPDVSGTQIPDSLVR